MILTLCQSSVTDWLLPHLPLTLCCEIWSPHPTHHGHCSCYIREMVTKSKGVFLALVFLYLLEVFDAVSHTLLDTSSFPDFFKSAFPPPWFSSYSLVLFLCHPLNVGVVSHWSVLCFSFSLSLYSFWKNSITPRGLITTHMLMDPKSRTAVCVQLHIGYFHLGILSESQAQHYPTKLIISPISFSSCY